MGVLIVTKPVNNTDDTKLIAGTFNVPISRYLADLGWEVNKVTSKQGEEYLVLNKRDSEGNIITSLLARPSVDIITINTETNEVDVKSPEGFSVDYERDWSQNENRYIYKAISETDKQLVRDHRKPLKNIFQ